MMKLPTLIALQLFAAGAQAGLIRDLMSYGHETVEEVEGVGAEARVLAEEAGEAVLELAEEAGEMAFEVTADIAGKSFEGRELWSCDTWPDCYVRPWWCTSGSDDPEGYCISHFGPYAAARKWHHCYNNPWDDCTCMNDNYEVVNGQCVEKFCAADPDQFCIDQYGDYGKPKWWKRDCVQDAHDCTCHRGYSVRNHECMKCADEPSWWCKEQYGMFGIPRHDRHCFIYPSDCMCMDGYVLDEGQCVENHCGDGYSLVHGVCHEDLDGCAWDPWWYCMSICGPKGIPRTHLSCIKTVNDCMCEEGSWPYDGICIEEPGGFGDPHFVTFHGHEFQFHGECDLVLVKAPMHHLDIHVRTTIRYDYSFISQAAVRVGEHIFEVGSWGEYQLDGMATIDLPVLMDNHLITVDVINDVKKKYKFRIHLDDGKGIEIVSFKDYVSVKLANATEEDFFDAVGLMGHYHGGDMIARDGETKMDNDPIAFGQEWQVRPREDGQLFSDAREPVYPQHKCRMPSANAISARDRNLAEAEVTPEQAKAACAPVEANKRADCYHDVRRSRDLEMALIYL